MTNSNFAHFMPDENEDSIITYFFFCQENKKNNQQKIVECKSEKQRIPYSGDI